MNTNSNSENVNIIFLFAAIAEELIEDREEDVDPSKEQLSVRRDSLNQINDKYYVVARERVVYHDNEEKAAKNMDSWSFMYNEDGEYRKSNEEKSEKEKQQLHHPLDQLLEHAVSTNIYERWEN